MRNQTYIYYSFLLLMAMTGFSCRKFVSIPEPINSITSKTVFSTNAQAASAMAGIYTTMINGPSGAGTAYAAFSNGLTTLLTGMSSDEFRIRGAADLIYTPYSTNSLLYSNSGCIPLWTSAYANIYGVNSILEGMAASTSPGLTDSVRKELTGEAKFVRAFCYFYLTNIFGDVPMALTVDFNKTIGLAKMSQAKVYQQIISDLKDAVDLLAADYSVGGGQRICPNKWAAMALLGRVYLYSGSYGDAVTQASAVIGQTSTYELASDLNQVFLASSREAIWQLQQSTSILNQGTATAEGVALLPNTLYGYASAYGLSDELMNAWEPGDQRRVNWVGTDNTTTVLPFYSNKYKVGANSQLGAPATEYYMVLRLAEQYLIRAEALARSGGDLVSAAGDVNVIRSRAGLGDLPAGLNADQVLEAVAHERQVEFFAEWGHRWLDLKRTGKAHDVLSQISYKMPWQGDYQLLYPIPQSDIKADPQLKQNAGY